MELKLFQEINGLPEEILHPKFKFLKNNPSLDGERKIITSWTDGFEDRDNKILIEFQTTFHSTFWEFYLYAFFKEMGFSIDFTKNRPDFIISHPTKINIEAVVSNIKEKGRKEETRNAFDILSMLNPPHLQEDFIETTNEAITRYSNAICLKHEKIVQEYSKLEWVDKDVPFVLALAAYDQVNYGREFYYPLLALLFGHYFNPKTYSFERIESILKPDTASEIPLGMFNDSRMEEISAILFSCTVTLGKLSALSKSINNSNLNLTQILNIRHDQDFPHFKIQDVSRENPEELSDGLFIFHNPYAKNPLKPDLFRNSNVTQIKVENKKIKFKGNNSPIFSRINIPQIIMPDKLKIQLIKETIYRFNYT